MDWYRGLSPVQQSIVLFLLAICVSTVPFYVLGFRMLPTARTPVSSPTPSPTVVGTSALATTTPAATSTGTPTEAPTPSATPTEGPTATPEPSPTPEATNTAAPTATSEPLPTATIGVPTVRPSDSPRAALSPTIRGPAPSVTPPRPPNLRLTPVATERAGRIQRFADGNNSEPRGPRDRDR